MFLIGVLVVSAVGDGVGVGGGDDYIPLIPLLLQSQRRVIFMRCHLI